MASPTARPAPRTGTVNGWSLDAIVSFVLAGEGPEPFLEGDCPLGAEAGDGHVRAAGPGRVDHDPAQAQRSFQRVSLRVDVLDPDVGDDCSDASKHAAVEEQGVGLEFESPEAIAQVCVTQEQERDGGEHDEGVGGGSPLEPEESGPDHGGQNPGHEQGEQPPHDLHPGGETFHAYHGVADSLERRGQSVRIPGSVMASGSMTCSASASVK